VCEYAIKSAIKEVFVLATNHDNRSGHGFSIDEKSLSTQERVIDKGPYIIQIFFVSKSDYESAPFIEMLQ
jgi:hypothetical protein